MVLAVKFQRMSYIHVDFQDLRQKNGLGYGLRYKNNGDGEDIEN